MPHGFTNREIRMLSGAMDYDKQKANKPLQLLKKLEYWFDTDMTFDSKLEADKNAEWLAEIRATIVEAT